MKAVGIDIGSLTTKSVVMEDNTILSSSLVASGENAESTARAAVERALKDAGSGFDDDLFVVATGMGGKEITFSRQRKTITTCLARGTNYLFPPVRFVIDMGAENSTVVKVSRGGRVNDWANHDKCAAGTGIFLQQMSRLLLMTLEEMSDLSFKAKAKAEITSTCAVFAESEVISHVHRDPPTPKEEVIAGIFSSVVSRIMALSKRIGIEREVAVTGGVALNSGLVHVLEQGLGCKAFVPDNPQLVAAIGAAVIAGENIGKVSG